MPSDELCPYCQGRSQSIYQEDHEYICPYCEEDLMDEELGAVYFELFDWCVYH